MSGSEPRESRRFGLPFGVFAAVLVLLPALLSFGLLRLGIANGRGSLIVIALVIAAFWLMFLVQTARAVTSKRDPN